MSLKVGILDGVEDGVGSNDLVGFLSNCSDRVLGSFGKSGLISGLKSFFNFEFFF